MDSAQQADGEKRVRQVLVDPLLRRGLAKPAALSKAQFAEMVEDLCARLAYMTDGNLAALQEQVAASPGGKDKDRLPIANRILEWAALIQPPGDDASPLIRAVFANPLGLDALAGGWAPELLADLRKSRRWPGAFAVKSIKEHAADPVRQMRVFDDVLARGGALEPAQEQWRSRRLAILHRCRQIAELSAQHGVKA